MFDWVLRSADEGPLDTIDATPSEKARLRVVADEYRDSQDELERRLLAGEVSSDEWAKQSRALEQQRMSTERVILGDARAARYHDARDAELRSAIDNVLAPLVDEEVGRHGLTDPPDAGNAQ